MACSLPSATGVKYADLSQIQSPAVENLSY